jgi:hypothetical protein
MLWSPIGLKVAFAFATELKVPRFVIHRAIDAITETGMLRKPLDESVDVF